MPGESMCFDARIRYWEEEWLSQLLEEALRLKGKATNVDDSPKDEQQTKNLSAGRMIISSE